MKLSGVWESLQRLKKKISDKSIIEGLRVKCCDEGRWGVIYPMVPQQVVRVLTTTPCLSKERDCQQQGIVMSLIKFHKAGMTRWSCTHGHSLL